VIIYTFVINNIAVGSMFLFVNYSVVFFDKSNQ